MLGVSGSSSLVRKLLLSLTLHKKVGAEWEQGDGGIPGRESGLEGPAMECWTSGHQLHLATLLKQVGKGNSNLKPIVHQNQLSCHLWHDCYGLSVLSFRNCKKGHTTMYFSRDQETRTKGQMWPTAHFCK